MKLSVQSCKSHQGVGAKRLFTKYWEAIKTKYQGNKCNWHHQPTIATSTSEHSQRKFTDLECNENLMYKKT